MLLELPLVESSIKFVDLKFSCHIFKCVAILTKEKNEDQIISLIDGYKTRPPYMEGVSLLDAIKSWMHNPKRTRVNKWEPRKSASIIRVIPRFVFIPPCNSDKWIYFYSLELLLYKLFHDIEDNDS